MLAVVVLEVVFWSGEKEKFLFILRMCMSDFVLYLSIVRLIYHQVEIIVVCEWSICVQFFDLLSRGNV